MGNAGRKMVEDKFSIQRMVKAYEVLFEGVVQQNVLH